MGSGTQKRSPSVRKYRSRFMLIPVRTSTSWLSGQPLGYFNLTRIFDPVRWFVRETDGTLDEYYAERDAEDEDTVAA